MCKRLPDSYALGIDRHANQPVTGPLEMGYDRVLELRVTVWTDDQQVSGVMAHLWVKMVYFKVRFAIPLFKSERTKADTFHHATLEAEREFPRVHPRGARLHVGIRLDAFGVATPEQCATTLLVPALAAAFLSTATTHLILLWLPHPFVRPEAFVGPFALLALEGTGPRRVGINVCPGLRG